MKRKQFAPRLDWEQQHKNIGFDYYNLPSNDGTPYWSEGAAYEFTFKEIEALERAANEVHEMCLDTVGHLIQTGHYPDYFNLPQQAIALIESSWEQDSTSIYGRFDFIYNTQNQIKLLEYNADTPTGLLEAAVAQWLWIEQVDDVPHRDQFNSIHEALIETWKRVLPAYSHIHFVATQEAGREDWGNLEYLLETAYQAKHHVSELCIEHIGWDQHHFVDLNNRPIQHLFKLYPWEWLWEEEFSQYIPNSTTQWIEPCWKMLLSNKALLVELWKRFPNHPYLVESHIFSDQHALNGKWAKKPILAREGANISILNQGQHAKQAQGSLFIPEYEQKWNVAQQWINSPKFNGQSTTLGLWMIDHACRGLSVREDQCEVIGDDAHFIPHYFIE